MEDSFYLAAYWVQRKESLDIVVNKTISFLQDLARLDEQFLNWYEQGYSKKEDLNKIIIDKENIEKLFRERVKKNDIDNEGYSKIGYSIGMWSGHEEEYSSGVSINCGHSSKFFSNSCVITIPTEGVQKERLLTFIKQKELVNLLIKSWQPDNVILSSSMLKSEIGTDEVGWITYYKSIRRIPKIINKVIYEKYDGGHLFYLANKNFYDHSLVNELLLLKDVL
ncbi:MAG: Imm52 family immunity protein [Ferruginibacter sp.]